VAEPKTITPNGAQIGEAVSLYAAKKLGIDLRERWAAEMAWQRSDRGLSVELTFVPASVADVEAEQWRAHGSVSEEAEPLVKACRRCSECQGEEHHFLEHVEHPDQSDDETTITEEWAGFICKHCEVKADQCEQCDGPIFPITGATVCVHCAAERGDAEP
jgi:hypothetical protein